MAVISITISASTEEIVSGIPTSVSISTNVPSTIFYTLDGTTPTIDSSVYVGPIVQTGTISSFTLSIFATNGVDSSAVVTQTFASDISTARLPHAEVIGSGTISNIGLYGSNTPAPNFTFANNANTGTTVAAAGVPTIASGNYDANGNPVGGTDEPLTNYPIIQSETDAEGQRGRGIGTLPKITYQTRSEYGPESSDRSDRLFNPRSFVIYQDASTENPDDPPMINKEFFSLENPGIVKDGALLFNQGLDSPSSSGSFVRAHYNERENTITYYYYDNSVCRWIISKQPYVNNNTQRDNLSGVVLGRSSNVFRWMNFTGRYLF